MPKLTEIAKRRIAAALPLRRGVARKHEMKKIEAAIQQFWTDDEEQFGIKIAELGVTISGLDRKKKRVFTYGRGKSYTSKGRPKREARHALIVTLVKIYERATGIRLGRSVQNVEPRKGLGKPDHRENWLPFLAACMRAAGTEYSFKNVRQALEKVRSADQ